MHIVPPGLENVRDMGFPTIQQLQRGIILGCIAKSFWLAVHDPVFYAFWDRDTYFEDEMQGEYWAACFPNSGGAVAVFYSSESSRNPFPEGGRPYDQSVYFNGMPEHLVPAKERALASMLDSDFEAGGPNAVITAAMWADRDRFTAIEPWDEVFYHSLWACSRHVLPPDVALREWWEGMALPGSGMETVRVLYERRIASTESVITVTPWEWQAFVEAAGKQPEAPKLDAARQLLGSVGIALP